MCTVRCAFRLGSQVKLSLHTSQGTGRSPLCTLRCLFKLGRWANRFLHTLQEKSRSPVCILIWLSRLEGLVKRFLHSLHDKGRSKTLNRRISLLLWVNDVTHISQRDNFSFVLTLVCPIRLFLWENDFLHNWHESWYSSLHDPDNCALFSPRISSALMQRAASVLVRLI
jgi:hypothetical protein